MNKIKLILIMWLGMMIVLLLQSAAFSQQKIIKVGGSWALTGPFAIDSQSCLWGTMDYLTYANERGLVKDIKFELIWADNKTEVPRGISIVEDNIAKGCMFNHSTVTAIYLAIKGRLNEKQIPTTVTGSLPPYLTEPTTAFLTQAVATDNGGAFIEWFLENWKESRKPRFAYLTADSAGGRAHEIPELTDYIKSKGIEVVGSQYVNTPQLSPPTTQLMWLKDNKIDLTYGGVVTSGMAPTVKEAVRLGMGRYEPYKIIFGCSCFSQPHTMIFSLDEKANGVIVGASYPPFEDKTPGMKLVNDLLKKYRAGKKPGFDIYAQYVEGVIHGMMIVETTRLALEKVPYEKLTPGDIIKHGFYRMKDFDTGGLTSSPLTFGPGKHYGVETCPIYELMHGRQVLLGKYPVRGLYRH
jgi:ABC-type branched-subunit amino acid transport system substrate-binding protein